MLEPPYFKRKNYELTVLIPSGLDRYFWTIPQRFDYEGILCILERVTRAGLEYRYKYLGMVWGNSSFNYST